MGGKGLWSYNFTINNYTHVKHPNLAVWLYEILWVDYMKCCILAMWPVKALLVPLCAAAAVAGWWLLCCSCLWSAASCSSSCWSCGQMNSMTMVMWVIYSVLNLWWSNLFNAFQIQERIRKQLFINKCCRTKQFFNDTVYPVCLSHKPFNQGLVNNRLLLQFVELSCCSLNIVRFPNSAKEVEDQSVHFIVPGGFSQPQPVCEWYYRCVNLCVLLRSPSVLQSH